jgi:hypothetical protein
MPDTPLSTPPSPVPEPNPAAEPNSSPGGERPGWVLQAWQWYSASFLNHFLTYLPLPLVVLLFLALLANFGQGYGVDKLIWYDEPLKQALVGASLTMVFAQVLFVGYLLWLRDQRENPKGKTFPEISFGRYAWQIVGFFLAMALVALGATWLMNAAAHRILGLPLEGPNPLEAGGEPEPYQTPWFLLLAALGGGFVFWLLSCKEIAQPWLDKSGLAAGLGRRLGRPVAVGVTRGVYSIGFLVVWSGLLFGVWGLLRLGGRGGRYPPHFWTLILGAFAGGVVVSLFLRLLEYLTTKDRLRQGVLAGLAQGVNGWFTNLMSKEDEGWRRWRNRLSWVAALLIWAVWGILFLLAWPRDAAHWLGASVVVVGLVVTILAWRLPRKTMFALCLTANGMAFVAGVTWLTSKGLTERSLLLIYPLVPLVALAILMLLICYTPRAAAAFFGVGSRQPRRGPLPGSTEDLSRWRAGQGLLYGWVFFVAVCSFRSLASPIPMICALLFVLVAFYGWITYYLRGTATLIVASLALLAILSGTNPYKFRFSSPLDHYEVGPPNAPNGPLPLEHLLDSDQRLIATVGPAISKYRWARDENLKAKMELVQRQKGAITDANERKAKGEPITDDDIAALQDKLNAFIQAEDAALKEVASLEPAAWEAFHKIQQENKVIDGPNPGPESPLLHDDRPKELLQIENVGWAGYGKLGGGPVSERAKKKPLLLVTVSGGGQRSAAWSLLVLHELEREFDARQFDFPAHVRLITGASGGMLGSAYYVTTLKAPGQRLQAKERSDELWDQFRKLAESDNITPLMRYLVFGDVPNFFSPWPAKYDRGKALEDAWRINLAGADGRKPLDTTFAELRPREKAGWCPSLVFSPMMIEDGRRLIISNLNLYGPISNDGNLLEPTNKEELISDLQARGVSLDIARQLVHEGNPEDINVQIQAFDWLVAEGDPRVQPNPAQYLIDAIKRKADLPPGFIVPVRGGNYSIEAFELFRLFSEAKNEFQVGTAVRMSASFPFFCPAVSLPTQPRRRMVDAGYYDNYGVSFSAAWLFSGRHDRWIRENASHVCIIQIRDGISDKSRQLKKVRKDESTELSRAVEELFSPLEGLDNARVGSSSFRNDGQLELLTQYMVQKKVPFQVVNFEFAGKAALNWRLSDEEIQSLKDEVKRPEFKSRIKLLLDFLASNQSGVEE